MAADIHASECCQLFVMGEYFRFRYSFIEEDEGLFFVRRRTEADEFSRRGIAAEMIDSLGLHWDASRSQHLSHR